MPKPSARYGSITSPQTSGQPKTCAPLNSCQWMSTQISSPNANSASGTSQGRRSGRRRHASTSATAAATAATATRPSSGRGTRPQAAMNSRAAA